MSIRLSYIRNLLLPLGLLAAAGCQHDDLRGPEQETEESPYLVIRIALPMSDGYTRSYPTGGEEGNGREEAVLGEDRIHDINVFFYADQLGLDGDKDTKILYRIYYNLDDKEDSRNTDLRVIEWNDATPYGQKFLELAVSATGKEVDNIKVNNGDHFAVVANAGYLSESITTLGALRDLKLTNTWISNTASSADAADMDRFVMSTGFNSEYFYNNRSTGKNIIEYKLDHYTGTATLERLAARIDLWYNSSENAGLTAEEASTPNTKKIERLVYNVENDGGSRVYIQNVLPVNVMEKPSFLFKKVTKNATAWTKADLAAVTQFNWAGKENPNDIQTGGYDRPTNYVIEPLTLEKIPDGSVEKNTEWFGLTALDKVKTAIQATANGKLTGYYDMKRERVAGDPDYDCDHISIIGYANENTNPIDCYHSTYLTGLVFKGLYIPEKVYKEFTPESGLVEMAKDEWTENFGLNDKLYRYSPSVENKVDESKSIYFCKQAALEAYMAAHMVDNAVVETYDYSIENGEYGLLCYYNLWLRHYNDTEDTNPSDPHEKLPMEYAIVRNNIYRVALAFNGPGDPTPTLREPDTMQARIFVRKWNLREEEDPLEF